MNEPDISVKPAKLFCQILAADKRVQSHEREANELQRQDRPHAANDEKAEADVAAAELIALLREANYLGMNTEEYPLVQRLYRKYEVGGNPLALGSSCH